jgi:ferredoxin-fold anticodon binding domain-containing protein
MTTGVLEANQQRERVSVRGGEGRENTFKYDILSYNSGKEMIFLNTGKLHSRVRDLSIFVVN